MIREYVKNRIAQAQALAQDPNLILCVEPLATDEGDNSGKVISLLRTAMAKPERSLVVFTGDAVVFGYARSSS